jgi:hypothetical protein
MSELKTWDDNAARRGGAVIAWINQADAPSLEAANSQGVCNAIVKDWISSCRGYTSDRGEFVKTFTARDKDGRLLNANVPERYIAQQEKLTTALKIYQTEARTRRLKIRDLEQKGDKEAAKQLRLEGSRANQRAFGGETCEKVAARASFDEVIDALNKVSTDDLYIALTFYWDTDSESFGHVVGIELRNDKHRFGFIDANLGLFSFPEFSSLISFWRDDVWPALYQRHGPKPFALYFYRIGHGGTGRSPSEQQQLDAENADEVERVQSSLEKKGAEQGKETTSKNTN